MPIDQTEVYPIKLFIRSLAIALSFLVMASPYAGAVFASVFFGNSAVNNRNRDHCSWMDGKKDVDTCKW